MVIVVGDVFPYEVLQSVSKVKNAELWSPSESTAPPAMSIPTQIIDPSFLGESENTRQKKTMNS